MKFIKVFICSAFLFTAAVQAQSWEEVCHAQAESAVKHKGYFKNNPGSLEFSLKRLEESGLNKKVQERIKEDLFFISNRRNISDETLRTMMFVRCIRQAQN